MAVLSVSGLAVSLATATGALAAPAPYTPPFAGPSGDVTVTLLDNTLKARMPIDFISLTATLYYNAVGSWALVAPYSKALWDATIGKDFSIEVNWRGMFKFGGKCEQPGYQDSMPGAGGSGQAGPFITLSGADYLALVANRIVYPDANTAWVSLNKSSTSSYTNTRLETVVKGFVEANMASTAGLASRRMTYLDIAPDLFRGSLISYSVKFSPNVSLNLLDVVRLMIIQGSGPTGMGVTIKRNGNRLVFDVYVPRDLSKSAWFSKQLGNLTAVQLYLTDPTCTNALVNGGGALLVEKIATSRTVWNVVEVYSDQTSETDTNNLNASAQQTLLAGGYGPLLNATVTDLPFLTFGRDYYLGDIVTIEVTPGNAYADVVTSVDLVASPGQSPVYSITPKIGHSGDATATDVGIIGQLSSRIRKLESKINIT